jgi:Pyruvate/2-oxoacid:ferredoxin oxidoreductase gamma subunit
MGVVDATGVAVSTIGVPITNTAILGAFSATTKVLKLESITEALKKVLPERIHKSNIEAVKKAYDQTTVKEM